MNNEQRVETIREQKRISCCVRDFAATPRDISNPPKGLPVNAPPGLIAGATGTWGAFGLHQARPAAAARLLWRHERRASLAAAHPVAPGLKSRRPNGRFLRRR
jgi:hypothetical protein